MNRHCLITGANRGIGLALTRALLARGDRVIATCRHPGKATALNHLTGDFPGRLHVLPLEVDKARSRAELVRELPLVAPHVDVLVNNAGVLHSGERFGTVAEEALEDSLRVNTVGPFLLVQALAAAMADGGVVANISSVLGSVASCTRFGTPTYSISKAAQNMATVQLAHALRPRGIRVVALHPGWVKTDMGGDGAEVAPEDSAAGLVRVIDGLGPDDTGVYLDWQGHALPW